MKSDQSVIRPNCHFFILTVPPFKLISIWLRFNIQLPNTFRGIIFIMGNNNTTYEYSFFISNTSFLF